jgi:hypothetical protein
MHLNITLPHPLARVARILEAVENARGGSPAVESTPAPPAAVARRPRKRPVEYRYDLETMSLSQRETPRTQTSRDLDLMSLCRDEAPRPGDGGASSDLSLNRSFPTVPGL